MARRSSGVALLVAISLWAARCGSRYPPGLPLQYESKGACPYEGCRYGEWVARTDAAVKFEPNVDSPITYRLRTGDRVQALTGIVTTLRPGWVRFDRTVHLQSTDGPLHVEAGDTLYLLTYQEGGPTTAWHHGRVYKGLDEAPLAAACEGSAEACQGTRLVRPRRTWWVQVRNASGNVGWTNEPDKFAKGNAS